VKAEKAQHVSGVIDERVERGRADGLAEPDRHDAARQAPRGGHSALDESNRGGRPHVWSPPWRVPRRTIGATPSVEEAIEGAAARTTCGSQTTAFCERGATSGRPSRKLQQQRNQLDADARGGVWFQEIPGRDSNPHGLAAREV
jgi:hypothetical protein